MSKPWDVGDVEQVSRMCKTTNLLGTYDNKSFWEEFGHKYIYTFANKDAEIMNKSLQMNVDTILSRMYQMEQLGSILEVGCGFGRVLGYVWSQREWLKYTKLVGIDISGSMIEKAKEFFKGSEINLEEELAPKIIQANVLDLPFDNKEFDLVYTHVCLTHIPPDKIQRAREEINRVAKRYIILVERYKWDYEHNTPHVWSHQHIPYFQTQGWEVLNYMEINVEHGTKALVLGRKE
jgi:ubiquinone/menaquinone biosynthesis C-methylase UbiE